MLIGSSNSIIVSFFTNEDTDELLWLIYII